MLPSNIWESGQHKLPSPVYDLNISGASLSQCHGDEPQGGKAGSEAEGEPPLTDSWLLQELAQKIESADAARKLTVNHALFRQPPYVAVLTRALDEALKVVGRSGSDVIDTVLVGRYGLHKEDIAHNPGEYMSAMKDILDTGCEVLERVMLEEIRKETGIVAMSMEEAVFRLKGYYGERTESERHLGARIENLGLERDG